METKLTFSEEVAVSTAICLRILELTKTINDSLALGQNCDVLFPVVDDLKSAFKKINGVDFNSVHHE